MVNDTHTIRRLLADELFECVYHFVVLALKGLKINEMISFKTLLETNVIYKFKMY